MENREIYKTLLSQVEAKICEELRLKLARLNVFQPIDTSAFSSVNFVELEEWEYKQNFQTNIRNYFYWQPLKIISQLMEDIKPYDVKIEAFLDPNNKFSDYRTERTFNFQEVYKIKDYYNIMSVNGVSYSIFHEGEDVTSMVLKIYPKVDHFDYITNNVYISGEYKLVDGESNIYILDEVDIEAEISFEGIENTTNIAEWLQYILEGSVHLKNDNMKMAIFNLFAGMDKFIEVIYEETFIYYLENYNALKSFAYQCIVNFKYMDKKGKEVVLTSEEKGAFYYEIEDFLIKKVKSYSKESRRLIDEKFVNVLKEIKMYSNDEFKKFQELVKRLRLLELDRNKIGHGEAFKASQVEYEDILYVILTLICSTVLQNDLDAEGWDALLR